MTVQAASDRFVTGATAIGKALGCSPVTVRRMIEDGRLKAFRIGGNTSPWKVWLSDIERIRRNRGASNIMHDEDSPAESASGVR